MMRYAALILESLNTNAKVDDQPTECEGPNAAVKIRTTLAHARLSGEFVWGRSDHSSLFLFLFLLSLSWHMR